MTCYILKTEFEIILQDVATLIGCKSHCTALHYVKTHRGRAETNKKYRKNYNDIIKILRDERLIPAAQEAQPNTKRILSPVLS